MTPAELARRIADAAVLRGRFTLRSGRISSYYVDKYLFLTRPDVLGELAGMIASRLPEGADRLAGAELGGVPLVAATSLACGLPGVYVRNERKGYGTGRRLEGRLEAGDRLVLLEDVATTGGQALEAAEVLREAGATVLGVIAVVDRDEGARQRLEAAGCAFDALFTAADLGLPADGQPEAAPPAP